MHDTHIMTIDMAKYYEKNTVSYPSCQIFTDFLSLYQGCTKFLFEDSRNQNVITF